jgi:squalene-hopene/tetraprenyl-beta-curcumene cyclase
VYGTSRVVLAYRALGLVERSECRRGLAWLVANQNSDGGWGGSPASEFAERYNRRSSVEETALAVEALAGDGSTLPLDESLNAGVEWLVERVEGGDYTDASPIGFYFAKLWYYERLYPLIFTVSALGRAAHRLMPTGEANAVATPAEKHR